MEILNLTSLDWEKNRIAMVAHSFRVMSRARNYDEMVVGIMHHVYASSSYARGLFDCDVEYDDSWKDALDLFVQKRKRLKAENYEDLPEELLLGLNMDQNLKPERDKVEQWMAEECRWSSTYRKKLDRIGANRIARNVLIYDLEDMLEILTRPEKIREEYCETIALPWKKDYLVEVYHGGRHIMHTRIPETDDDLLLRPLTDGERADLVEKYLRALAHLRKLEYRDTPRNGDFSEKEYLKYSENSMRWYEDWLDREKKLDEMYGDDEYDEDCGQ